MLRNLGRTLQYITLAEVKSSSILTGLSTTR